MIATLAKTWLTLVVIAFLTGFGWILYDAKALGAFLITVTFIVITMAAIVYLAENGGK